MTYVFSMLRQVEAAMALARGDTESIVVPLSILTSLVRQTVFVFEASMLVMHFDQNSHSK